MRKQILNRRGLHGNIFKRTRLTRKQIVNGLGSYANKNKSTIHCKKRLASFPSAAGKLLTKLSLDGNNLIIPAQGEFRKWHPDWGRENRKPFFYRVMWLQFVGFVHGSQA